MPTINNSFLTLLKNKNIFITLVIRDFGNRYLSSYIGLPWAFIQPIMYILVIWFAFTFGLRGGRHISGIAFAPWLITGLVPWLFISQTMIVSANAILDYSFLIKKTTIPVFMIPIVKVFSGMIVHITLVIGIMVILYFSYNISPSIYWIQIFYYLFALTILLVGIALLISSINVFLRDMAHLVNIFVTMLFWATPIIWPYSMLHGNYRYIALLNPFFYIIEGYRYTFIEHTWFFEYTEMNFLFWIFTLLIFTIGSFTFKKLQPMFADMF